MLISGKFKAQLVFIFLLLTVFGAAAQINVPAIWDQQHPASNIYQPARITDFNAFKVSTFGNLWLGNNGTDLQGILQSNNVISTPLINDILGQLGDKGPHQFHQGSEAGILINAKVKDFPISLSYYFHQGISGEFQDTATLGLIFRGNAPYAGRTISDEKVFWKDQRYSAIGIGTGWTKEKWSLGFRLNVLLGHQLLSIDDMQYSFFTQDNGSSIDVSGNYALNEAFEPGIQGLGLGLDAGLIYNLSKSSTLQVAVKNLGWINWEVDQLNHEVDFTFEGFRIDDLLDENLDLNDIVDQDSLLRLVFPDTAQANFSTSLPAQVQIAFSHQLDERQAIHAAMSAALSQYSPSGFIPAFSFGYQYKPVAFWNLFANGYLGGIDRYGFGLSSSLAIPLQGNGKINFGLGSHNLLGLVLPSVGQGLGIQAQLGFEW